VRDYTSAIQCDEKFIAAYYNRALTKNTLAEYEGAITDYTRAVELGMREPIVFNCRAYAKNKLA
jgi:hypothetical protein